MGGAVRTDDSGSINRKRNIDLLNGNIVYELIIGTL
jgi:hypothetical protein